MFCIGYGYIVVYIPKFGYDFLVFVGVGNGLKGVGDTIYYRNLFQTSIVVNICVSVTLTNNVLKKIRMF